jgi:hypothetical protein
MRLLARNPLDCAPKSLHDNVKGAANVLIRTRIRLEDKATLWAGSAWETPQRQQDRNTRNSLWRTLDRSHCQSLARTALSG